MKIVFLFIILQVSFFQYATAQIIMFPFPSSGGSSSCPQSILNEIKERNKVLMEALIEKLEQDYSMECDFKKKRNTVKYIYNCYRGNKHGKVVIKMRRAYCMPDRTGIEKYRLTRIKRL